MSNLLQRLWSDDCGALISIEFLFVATILVIGIIVGLVNLRDAVNAELTQLGDAILALSQGYAFSGISGCNVTVDGSQAIVILNQLPQPTSIPPAMPQVISVLPCN